MVLCVSIHRNFLSHESEYHINEIYSHNRGHMSHVTQNMKIRTLNVKWGMKIRTPLNVKWGSLIHPILGLIGRTFFGLAVAGAVSC